MRFILVDWGTTRFRAFVVDGETIVDRVSSDEGVSALREGQHREVFLKHCRDWLAREPQAPVALVGMVGSREGWRMAPYAPCPAGPEEIAGAMALLTAAFPNLQRAEAKHFAATLCEDVTDEKPTLFAVVRACRRVRRRYEFLSIATVMRELQLAKRDAHVIDIKLNKSRLNDHIRRAEAKRLEARGQESEGKVFYDPCAL